ncbi:uncharacterized protein E0L32_010029 [Thyridium curvatum]|uniref:LysM domain-containing protein n=1 Tax=Thyridium curvatum TaxID=1093900 RepID=A0A507AHK8_9PEZI|nr:uncharacterized protein E0L32_010029 [Thyridium curvatum]TPX08542.1 hypothetical protein E0L32_010029 [Thyridium curvatum]
MLGPSSTLASLVLCLISLRLAQADFVIFEPGLLVNTSTPVAAGEVSQQCISALESTITCDPYLRTSVLGDSISYLAPSILDGFCTSSCGQSLSNYHQSVQSACGGGPQLWQGTPATLYGDQVWAQYNITCFKDSKGQYCQNAIANLTSPDSDQDASILTLPKAALCSECVLKLGQLIQSTAFSNYGLKMAQEWASIQSTCGVTYPTNVQPIAANRTDIPGYAPSGYPVAECVTGKSYTVVGGDDCGKIASANKVPRGALLAVNNVLPDCSDLQIGQQLCLPNPCTLYNVQSGDTCGAITSSQNLTLTQLLSWNAFISPACTNLIAGDSLCVSQPGVVYTGTAIPDATATQTGVYATATVAPPGPVPHGTTAQCGKYYGVKTGDYCQLIAINNTISVDLFEAINPSIDTGCTNLVPGFYYCVFPVLGWNETTSTTSTYVTPPAPTPSGTTGNCYEWHIVVSGDDCSKIEAEYGVSIDQLRQWNPQLKSDCSNLLLDDAYCVHGDAATATSTYVTPPAPTPSGTTGNCYQWHVIVSGDYCAKIESDFNITFAQLQKWNPQLDNDCTNLLLDEAYCVKGDDSTTKRRINLPARMPAVATALAKSPSCPTCIKH